MNEIEENLGWALIENEFHPGYNKITERLMRSGNGCVSQMANFEERFTGETDQGNYLTGISDPELSHDGKARKGHTGNSHGFLSAADWRGIDVRINSEILDLNTSNILYFRRILNMQTAILYRSFAVELPSGKQLKVDTHRFLSIVDPEIGAIKYTVTPLNFSDKLTLIPFIDFEPRGGNEKKDRKFWDEVAIDVIPGEGYLSAEVCKALSQVCTGMKINILRNGIQSNYSADVENRHKYIANIISLKVTKGESVTIEKFGINVLSQNYPKGQLMEIAKDHLNIAFQKGFEQLEKEHTDANLKRWDTISPIRSQDKTAQLQMRFNQFRQFQKFQEDDGVPIEDELPEWLLQ